MISLSHKLSPYVQPLMNILVVMHKIKTTNEIVAYLDMKEEMTATTWLEF